RTHWFNYDELLQSNERHRSPMVMQCINDYLAGRRFPLDMVKHL
ncbi:MAG: NUDIX hydrolase, partial [Gammaproteobacteria bacterium]